MRKLLLLFVIDHCIERLTAKYKARSDKLDRDVTIKGADDE